MNNTLLVLTDFSDNAWSSVRYAAFLAERFQWNLHILHTYTLSANLAFQEHLEDDLAERRRAEQEKKFETLTARVANLHPTLPTTTALMAGEVCDTVLGLLQESSYVFVLMGATGAGSLKKRTLGSNTLAMIKRCPIGVIAVPEELEQLKLDKIGLLSNFKYNELAVLQSLTDRLPSPVNLLLMHVTEKGVSPEQEKIDSLQAAFAQQPKLNNVAYAEKNAVYRLDYYMPIPHAIDWLIEKEGVDLLIVSYNRKSFFTRFVSRNLPKFISNNLLIPTYFRSEKFL